MEGEAGLLLSSGGRRKNSFHACLGYPNLCTLCERERTGGGKENWFPTQGRLYSGDDFSLERVPIQSHVM